MCVLSLGHSWIGKDTCFGVVVLCPYIMIVGCNLSECNLMCLPHTRYSHVQLSGNLECIMHFRSEDGIVLRSTITCNAAFFLWLRNCRKSSLGTYKDGIPYSKSCTCNMHVTGNYMHTCMLLSCNMHVLCILMIILVRRFVHACSGMLHMLCMSWYDTAIEDMQLH